MEIQKSESGILITPEMEMATQNIIETEQNNNTSPKSEDSITKRFSFEIQDINNKLQQLENGRIYEFSRAQMDGYLSTNISQLKKMFADLIWKLENDLKSRKEEMGEALGRITF